MADKGSPSWAEACDQAQGSLHESLDVVDRLIAKRGDEEDRILDKASQTLAVMGNFFLIIGSNRVWLENPDVRPDRLTASVEWIVVPSQSVRDLSERLLASRKWPRELLSELNDLIDDLAERFLSLVERLSLIPPELSDSSSRLLLWEVLEEARRRIETVRAVREISDARDEIISARDAARRATGETGSLAQSNGYDIFADREATIATRLRYGAAAALVAISGLAVTVAYTSDFTSLLVEIGKLAAALPLAVLAAYLGRESNRHRAQANWAYERSMQLETFDAFVAPMDEDKRDEVRLVFSRILYSKIERQEFEPEPGPSVIAESIKLLEAAREMGASRLRPKSAFDATSPREAPGVPTARPGPGPGPGPGGRSPDSAA